MRKITTNLNCTDNEGCIDKIKVLEALLRLLEFSFKNTDDINYNSLAVGISYNSLAVGISYTFAMYTINFLITSIIKDRLQSYEPGVPLLTHERFAQPDWLMSKGDADFEAEQFEKKQNLIPRMSF